VGLGGHHLTNHRSHTLHWTPSFLGAPNQCDSPVANDLRSRRLPHRSPGPFPRGVAPEETERSVKPEPERPCASYTPALRALPINSSHGGGRCAPDRL